ncbi:unnamed protein product [Trichogramma brassicae]|uniref:adenylate cyclase n=1 Tax=Trichogramma brassicae TaxID=86971 RepID=A0A6H5J6X0_9HYME|nr:unnamed protein product [Trichogramma brassicae]
MAGLLGAIKWQYDIWSRDVCVANKMEQTGRPGKVHVTEKTLELLNRDNYCVEELDQSDNEILNKYGITKSYLITPVKQCEVCQKSTSSPATLADANVQIEGNCIELAQSLQAYLLTRRSISFAQKRLRPASPANESLRPDDRAQLPSHTQGGQQGDGEGDRAHASHENRTVGQVGEHQSVQSAIRQVAVGARVLARARSPLQVLHPALGRIAALRRSDPPHTQQQQRPDELHDLQLSRHFSLLPHAHTHVVDAVHLGLRPDQEQRRAESVLRQADQSPEKFMGMDNTMLNRLYHEKHEYVAVMFATLTNLSIENVDTLSNYNKIICHFDLLLFNAMFQHRVEKIKLAGTTYMAASGLDNLRRNSGGENSPGKYSVLKVLTRFAAEIMRITENINSQVNGSYALRIGICTGEVTAGVVGVKKPLYDIWGDAVNMASRMDTTGVPGKIQVLKETADTLEKLGVRCHLRGETYVKPKGLLTTYFVGVDADGQLERCGTSLLPDIEEDDEDEERDASKL